MAKPPPLTHRVRVENEMIKRREKEFRHDQMWNGQRQYYENWEKKNSKFEEWTSPRYHETQSKMEEKLKKKREHEENLEKRREKLTKLLHEEDQLYQTELMILKTRHTKLPARYQSNVIPSEVLRELNLGLKLEEDVRRRHEAELRLYHQWRGANPVLQHYERMQRGRDLKLSWLDQQIENRMKREKEEEECRKILKEREKMLKEEQRKEEEYQKQSKEKQEQLRLDLEQQIKELEEKSKLSDEFKQKEHEEMRKKFELEELAEKQKNNEKLRIEKEYALCNVKQYRIRLRKRAEIIQENLEKEKEVIQRLREIELAESIEDEIKRNEIKETINQFLAVHEEQKKLEKCRQKHFEFLFDSEAKYQYEQQEEIWRHEEKARLKLMQDVLETVKEQIADNLEKHKEKQREIIKEREELIERIEEYNNEMNRLKQEEARRKTEMLKTIDEDVYIKNVRKKDEENKELKKVNEELERVQREEERLKKEILDMQRRRGPIRPARSKIFF